VRRFLGNTDAAGRHEGILQFITGRGNVTGAEVEAFYRQGIGLLIGTITEQAFPKSAPAETFLYVNQSITNFLVNPNQTTYNVARQLKQAELDLTFLP
jgi:hypothetical protein